MPTHGPSPRCQGRANQSGTLLVEPIAPPPRPARPKETEGPGYGGNQGKGHIRIGSHGFAQFFNHSPPIRCCFMMIPDPLSYLSR